MLNYHCFSRQHHLINLSTYARSSVSESSEIIRKTRAVTPEGSLLAVSDSVITNDVERRPFSQPRSRASRKLNASASSPAATRIARAQRRKSGQLEMMAISAFADGALSPCNDSATERARNVSRSV